MIKYLNSYYKILLKLKPNILYLDIDSFRADRFYGKTKTSKTPNIDSLLKSSTYFDQTIVSADGTIISLNSVFTGLFPYATGTRAIKLLFNNKNYIHLLQEFGYNIYGVIPKLTSLSPLFELCLNDNPTYDGGPPAKSLFDEVGQKIIDVFSTQMKGPWFYYAHIMDLHWPLNVPKQYDDSQFGMDKYDRIVSSIDYWIGKILDNVDLKNTIIIITADHGTHIPINDKNIRRFEPKFKTGVKIGKRLIPTFAHPTIVRLLNFLRKSIRNIKLKQVNKNLSNYEKRSRLPYFTLSLFDESIRIPLLIAGYNMTSKIISQQIRSLDIFPTIMDMINGPNIENIHGKSLKHLIDGDESEAFPAYLHTIPYQDLSPQDMVGIRTSKYKYFRGSRNSSHNVNLYNLQIDPSENNNIAKNNPQLIKEFETMLTNMISNKNKYLENVGDTKGKDNLKKRISEKKSKLSLKE